MLFPPRTTLLPAMGTSGTSLLSPGSKRTAVPAGTLSRLPRLAARSNESSAFVSMKWKCEPDLDGPVPGVGHLEQDARTALVQGDVAERVGVNDNVTRRADAVRTRRDVVPFLPHDIPEELDGLVGRVALVGAARLALLAALLPGRVLSSPGSGGKASFFGVGRKEPYRASERSPSSVAIGSCTVTSLVPSTNVPST